MAQNNESGEKLVYPPGVRDITEDISTDDLVRRLKDCALAFQNMSQDEDNTPYIPLALHLASEFFIEHSSKDVQLLTASCIADVFRVYAPDAPYKDPSLLKVIFEFFIDQLKGLKDTEDPSFKRYFYLLENLTWVKTFNICAELEENQQIFCRLFKLMFSIVSDKHSAKVKKFMIDMLSPLISEADIVSPELLDILLNQIIEPNKSKNRNAYMLASEILNKTSATLEPYIQAFFNSAMVLGKTTQNKASSSVYDLIYELNIICSSVLVAVLPQLEFKLKSSDENERIEVSRILAKMFSDKNSQLANQNPALWRSFIGRFNDISGLVRMRCVQWTVDFLVNQPDLKPDITEQLRQRQHDVEENVRYEAVAAIISAAKRDITCVNEELLNFVKERTLDKKFKIRKEALLGLATLYKKHVSNPGNTPMSTPENLTWITNKVLHVYYQTSLEDRLLVERILHTCLVPYQAPVEERMKKLYRLFATVDDHAMKALIELIRCQNIVRKHMRNLLDVVQCDSTDYRTKTISTKVSQLSKHLQDSTKAQDYVLKFCNAMESNLNLRNMVISLLSGTVTCSDAELYVKRILKALGVASQNNPYYMTVKQLLERVAPVMIDKEAIKYLVTIEKDCLLESGVVETELGIVDSATRGLQLLEALSTAFPMAFQQEDVYNDLLLFLQADDESAIETSLQILINTTSDIERKFPSIAMRLIPLLESFAETGTKKQAKLSIYCLNGLVSDKETVFGLLIENLKKHFTLESQYFRTALVSIGHIAYLCHDMFAAQLKSIVSKVVVKDLLMLDQDLPRGGEANWAPLESVPDETKVKIEGMKLMVRWLMGLKNAVPPATSTIRLLNTVIINGGDLMERQHTAPFENSWLRYTAASCMLKLCQEKKYAGALTLEQYQVLASVINDQCFEVRERFAKKLYKGLMHLHLPLKFMAIYALAGIEENKELKKQIKNNLLSCIKKRREYLKQQSTTNQSVLVGNLPDYALPYAIHLLAHAPFLKTYDDVPSLLKVKECLWLFMEPIVLKNENYSFAFVKRLIENIKQTKDKQCVNDNIANLKLYAVCDLALGLVMSKSNFLLKEFPAKPLLPSELFTEMDKSFSNMKTYLPPELVNPPPKDFVFEVDIFSASDNKTVSENSQQSEQVMSDISKSNHIEANSVSPVISDHESNAVNGSEDICNSNNGSETASSIFRSPRIRPKQLTESTKENNIKQSDTVQNEKNNRSNDAKKVKQQGAKPAKAKHKEVLNRSKESVEVKQTGKSSKTARKTIANHSDSPTEIKQNEKPTDISVKEIVNNSHESVRTKSSRNRGKTVQKEIMNHLDKSLEVKEKCVKTADKKIVNRSTESVRINHNRRSSKIMRKEPVDHSTNSADADESIVNHSSESLEIKQNGKQSKTMVKDVADHSNDSSDSIVLLSENISSDSQKTSSKGSSVTNNRSSLNRRSTKFTKIRTLPTSSASSDSTQLDSSKNTPKRKKLKASVIKNNKAPPVKENTINSVLQKLKMENMLKECNVTLTRENLFSVTGRISLKKTSDSKAVTPVSKIVKTPSVLQSANKNLRTANQKKTSKNSNMQNKSNVSSTVITTETSSNSEVEKSSLSTNSSENKKTKTTKSVPKPIGKRTRSESSNQVNDLPSPKKKRTDSVNDKKVSATKNKTKKQQVLTSTISKRLNKRPSINTSITAKSKLLKSPVLNKTKKQIDTKKSLKILKTPIQTSKTSLKKKASSSSNTSSSSAKIVKKSNVIPKSRLPNSAGSKKGSKNQTPNKKKSSTTTSKSKSVVSSKKNAKVISKVKATKRR